MISKVVKHITYPPYLLGNFLSCSDRKMSKIQILALFYETCKTLKVVSEEASYIKINEYIADKLKLGQEWINTIIYIWNLQIFIKGFYFDDIERKEYFKKLNTVL